MYTLCATEKTARQQRQFEKVFLQMMLENDYDSITISELCRQAGLSRKIFYRLFEKKADVLYALIDHTLLDGNLYTPDESVGSGDLHRFFAFWHTQEDLLDALLKHQTSSLLIDRAVRFAFNEDTSLIHTFGADSGKFGFESIVFYMTGIFSLILTWHMQGYNHSIDEMSTLMMEMLTTPAIKNRRNQ